MNLVFVNVIILYFNCFPDVTTTRKSVEVHELCDNPSQGTRCIYPRYIKKKMKEILFTSSQN